MERAVEKIIEGLVDLGFRIIGLILILLILILLILLFYIYFFIFILGFEQQKTH